MTKKKEQMMQQQLKERLINVENELVNLLANEKVKQRIQTKLPLEVPSFIVSHFENLAAERDTIRNFLEFSKSKASIFNVNAPEFIPSHLRPTANLAPISPNEDDKVDSVSGCSML